MPTVNWVYQIYIVYIYIMKCFAPAVQAFIFVDNPTLMAREALAVIEGYFAMLSFVALFSLTMDDEKTYVWGLTAASRQTLLQLNFPCQFASELAGGFYDLWSENQQSPLESSRHWDGRQLAKASQVTCAFPPEDHRASSGVLASGLAWLPCACICRRLSRHAAQGSN